MIVLIGLLAAGIAWLAARRRFRNRLGPARALILSPPSSTVVASDGSVRSVQSARLSLPPDELARLWTPANLENLGRTYWLFLTRVTLGMIRVRYGQDDRQVTVLGTPLTLLRFSSPEYTLDPDHGRATWQIKDGMLVARGGHDEGHLSLDVSRSGPGELTIEVEVANFYPAIAFWFSTFVYEATQSFVHVLVTHAFLRSLATLELDESPVGQLRSE
jgi:hypothetical protein